jgi:hypothetical protein
MKNSPAYEEKNHQTVNSENHKNIKKNHSKHKDTPANKENKRFAKKCPR